jgi:FkbM family methyltransferase
MRNLKFKEAMMSGSINWSWRERAGCKSQCEEDKFLEQYFKGKKNGYLLDIAAADGMTCSNSFKLINDYDWNGLLIEPCPKHKEVLKTLYDGVNGVNVYYGAVHQTLTKVPFYEVEEKEIGLSNTVGPTGARGYSYTQYEVESLDINSILQKYNVPDAIDFFSLDIETSEGEVINNWNFEKYYVQLWMVEGGERFQQLFQSKGYERIVSVGLKVEDVLYQKLKR